LNHYKILHLPLADLPATEARGVWLTNSSVRVMTELIAEANHQCVKSKNCGKNCKKCVQYSRTCVAPIVMSGKSAASLVDSSSTYEVKAWAACDGISTHCLENVSVAVAGYSTSPLVRYAPSTELQASKCYKKWVDANHETRIEAKEERRLDRGMQRKGYVDTFKFGSTPVNSWSTAVDHAEQPSAETYTIGLSEDDSSAIARFYGWGMRSAVKALVVDYPTDPDKNKERYSDSVIETAIVCTLCALLFAGLLAAAMLIDPGTAGCAALLLLIGTTVYRAMRMPGA